MGTMSIWHWLIVLIVVLLLFGTSKVSSLMGDVAKGIKAFKKNMAEDEPDIKTNDLPPKNLPPSDPSVSFNASQSKSQDIKEPTSVSQSSKD